MNGARQEQRLGSGFPPLRDWGPKEERLPEGLGAEAMRITLKLAPAQFDLQVIVYRDQPLDWT